MELHEPGVEERIQYFFLPISDPVNSSGSSLASIDLSSLKDLICALLRKSTAVACPLLHLLGIDPLQLLMSYCFRSTSIFPLLLDPLLLQLPFFNHQSIHFLPFCNRLLLPNCNAARQRLVYSRVAKPPFLLYIDYRGEDLPLVASILPTHHTAPYHYGLIKMCLCHIYRTRSVIVPWTHIQPCPGHIHNRVLDIYNCALDTLYKRVVDTFKYASLPHLYMEKGQKC